MQQPQQRVQCCCQHRRGMRNPFGQLRFGQFDVPVAEFVPGEVVERFTGPAELVVVERRIDFRANLFQPPKDPSVGVGQLVERRQLRQLRAVEQRIAGGVEQLGAEVARRPDVILPDRQIAAGAGAAGQGEPQGVGAEHVHPVERVDDVALGLAHLATGLVADQPVQEDVGERHLRAAPAVQGDGVVVADEGAEHHHSGHPEEEDVVAGDQNACGIELFQLRRLLRPAQGGERPQRRGEPGVQHVGVLLPALGRRFVGADAALFAVGPVPDRDAVAPPQLPRDAPVVHVVHPGEPARFHAGRVNHRVAVADRVTGGLGQRFHSDPPLQRQPRLDRLAAALGMPDAVQVGSLLLDDAALRGQRLAHRDPGREPVHAVELCSGVGDSTPGVHDRDHRQLVAQPDLEVVGVVRGRDFDCAGAEFGVDVLVGDDQQLPVHERVRQAAADQVPVALVVGMHRDGGVAQHRLDPGGGHHDVRARVVERAVAERHQLALDLLVVDLDVGEGRLQHRRPVDQPLGAVDQPGVVEPFEDGAHGPGQALVHGEPVAAPVHPVAEPAHLAADGAAGLALPVPHLLDEQLATEVLFGLAVDGELLFHHALGRDAGVIHAGLPEHLVALHPLAPGQGVHHGVLQRVAHVQAAGDVGRRQHDRVAGFVAGRVRGEVPGVHPLAVDRVFGRGRVPRLGQVGGGAAAGGHPSILGSDVYLHVSARTVSRVTRRAGRPARTRPRRGIGPAARRPLRPRG